MGKNKRKKKQKEEDFKRVKLKVGKKLPKGTNETQTSFKSKGIVVPSQDLTKEGQLTNTRRQGLKDLLSHLSHYSPTVRQEALHGLRSLFQQHSHIFHENISLILGPIAAKMTDTDSDVRRSLLLLLCSILPHLPPEQAAPFLPLLVAHLSCAMSHIYEDIQLESLEFFSLFLKLFPKQISENSTQLLDNFIGLISQHSGGTLNQRSSKGSTKIAVNPKGKLSSPKARLKILSQIYEFLKALYVEDNTTHTQMDLSTGASSCSQFSQTKMTCHSVHYGNGKEPSMCFFSFGDKTIALENKSQNPRENTKELEYNSDVKFMQKIVPLLLQFWVECNPSQLSTSLPDNALPAVNLSIMINVMAILKVLLHKLFNMKEENGNSVSLKNWLVSLYFKDFNTYFLKLFPFQDTYHSKAKRKAKVPKTSPDNLAMTLNISICEVMSFFVGISSASAKQARKIWMEQIEDFVVESLELTFGGIVGVDELKSLLIYAEKVLQDASDQEGSSSAERILSALYKLYKSSHLLSGVKNILLKFFATLIVRRQNPIISTPLHLSWQAPLKQWICTLPKLLVQLKTASHEMTYTVLKVLSSLMKQTFDVDGVELQIQLNCFLDPTSGPFCKLSREIQNTTIELLFSLPVINTCILQTLALCSHQQAVPAEVVKYLIQVLHYRSPASSGYLDKPSAFNLSSYLSFLFSVAIGYTREELHNLQTSNGETVLSSHKIVNDTDMAKRWNRNQDILQAVCMIYVQHQHADQLIRLMEPVLEKTLKETKVLPLTMADSLLQLCKCLLVNVPKSSTEDGDDQASCIALSLVSHLAELSFACVLYTMKNDDTMDSNLDVTNCLFSDVMQLLTVQPSILEKLLDILFAKTSDLQSYSHKVTMMTAKLLQSFGKRDNPMFYSEAVGGLVYNILEKLRSQENQGSYFSDLDYQCSMFRIEVNRRKEKQ